MRLFVVTIALSTEFAALNLPEQGVLECLSVLSQAPESEFIDIEDIDYNKKVYNVVYNQLYDKVIANPNNYGLTRHEIVDKIRMNAIERIIHEIALYAAHY